ncbi:hypothetical protein MSAN_01897700 [Mycena sanguinolenta]|uniref:Uncharacterized protein n=1 Tax=Mycena sanguinolenta TaxID=230812 RepID=A0A8H6XQD2_9AGAR|nr:hypothetical protein MSAN_01897700 [Mycena sanguinolenta]
MLPISPSPSASAIRAYLPSTLPSTLRTVSSVVTPITPKEFSLHTCLNRDDGGDSGSELALLQVHCDYGPCLLLSCSASALITGIMSRSGRRAICLSALSLTDPFIPEQSMTMHSVLSCKHDSTLVPSANAQFRLATLRPPCPVFASPRSACRAFFPLGWIFIVQDRVRTPSTAFSYFGHGTAGKESPLSPRRLHRSKTFWARSIQQEHSYTSKPSKASFSLNPRFLRPEYWHQNVKIAFEGPPIVDDVSSAIVVRWSWKSRARLCQNTTLRSLKTSNFLEKIGKRQHGSRSLGTRIYIHYTYNSCILAIQLTFAFIRAHLDCPPSSLPV